ncbi:hypothetical protein CAPTEDRAFT_205449 [Capitella teleta]|uniref:Uncharacterized protein n=1 Tax=Capitella teleta TaxID=283909 RepID=R7TSQ4_CAPTE|nr:hypothetical protein CAPTEDRAFT_205449 [Capitella teleta]|eukprot:ELT94516.1 hypothetical protein CAPTEDRAFT_205449 [Capitella teleta]
MVEFGGVQESTNHGTRQRLQQQQPYPASISYNNLRTSTTHLCLAVLFSAPDAQEFSKLLIMLLEDQLSSSGLSHLVRDNFMGTYHYVTQLHGIHVNFPEFRFRPKLPMVPELAAGFCVHKKKKLYHRFYVRESHYITPDVGEGRSGGNKLIRTVKVKATGVDLGTLSFLQLIA